MSTIINVNGQLSEFSGTQCYYQNPNIYFKYTEGIKYLAEQFQCYWLLTDISLHSKSLNNSDEHQVWKLTRQTPGGYSFLLTCEDGNYNPLFKTEILFSDFNGDEVTIWVVDEIMLLPSEY